MKIRHLFAHLASGFAVFVVYACSSDRGELAQQPAASTDASTSDGSSDSPSLDSAADTLVDALRDALGDVVPDAHADPTAGTRLKPAYSKVTSPDGLSVRTLAGYWDATRGEYCAATTAADLVTRCLPTDAALNYPGYFVDASCTKPLLTRIAAVAPSTCAPSPPTPTPPKYGLIAGSCGEKRVFPIAGDLPDTTPIFSNATGTCASASTPIIKGVGYTFTIVDSGAEIPATAFVALTTTREHD